MTDNTNNKFEVTFWGTRGTLPVSGVQFEQTGGNTNCIEITCNDHTIIIDAGTGIRELGSKLISTTPNQNIHLFLTHAHYDHVEGIPFFAPFFMEEKKINIHCGELDGISDTKNLISELMKRPFFPVGPEVFVANTTYITLEDHASFSIGKDIKITTCPLNHPGGSTAYRIDFAGKSFACVTDTEHTPGKPDENILKLIDGIDAFSYDCSLLDQELSDFEGYGHSTYEEGIRLARQAKAGKVLASHHMPFRTDAELQDIENRMKKEFDGFQIAMESLKIKF